jgi:predicted RNase H-like HicB family nuclease
MRTFNVIVERDPDTGVFVGSVPGWPGAHTQGASLDELAENLQEVIEMLLEDGERLAELAARGLVTLPRRTSHRAFQGPALPNRGKLASEMVLEDRR